MLFIAPDSPAGLIQTASRMGWGYPVLVRNFMILFLDSVLVYFYFPL